MLQNRFRRPKSPPARGIGKKMFRKGVQCKKSKIASLGLNNALVKYDPKHKKVCFQKSLWSVTFLKIDFFPNSFGF